MECNIIQEFKGEIGGVEFDDKHIYYASQFILEKIENKFGEVYNREFIKDLRDTIETMEYKYDEFSFAILEDDFYKAVKEAKSFNEIEFSYYGSDWKIDNLNENIKNNKYEISNEKVNSFPSFKSSPFAALISSVVSPLPFAKATVEIVVYPTFIIPC